MDWLVPKRRLDRDQTHLLNTILDDDGNFFLKGCPGTGKSVILAHLAREYKAIHPNAKVAVLTYTNALVALLKDGLRGDVSFEIETLNRFVWNQRRRPQHYELILVDEVQDMKPEWGSPIAEAADRVALFGDFAQSIYDETISEPMMLQWFSPAVEALRTIYRLSMNIKQLVETVFPAFILNAPVGGLVANTDIQLAHGPSYDDEINYVIDKAKNQSRVQHPAAVLFETRRQMLSFFHQVATLPNGTKLDDTLNAELRKQGVPFRFLGNGFGSFDESDTQPIVYVMTWHSAKGLDFDSVLLPDITNSMCNTGPFYVAMTRARRYLLISYSGNGNKLTSTISTCPSVQQVDIGVIDDGEEPLF